MIARQGLQARNNIKERYCTVSIGPGAPLRAAPNPFPK
jgi:hypothetical protein